MLYMHHPSPNSLLEMSHFQFGAIRKTKLLAQQPFYINFLTFYTFKLLITHSINKILCASIVPLAGICVQAFMWT